MRMLRNLFKLNGSNTKQVSQLASNPSNSISGKLKNIPQKIQNNYKSMNSNNSQTIRVLIDDDLQHEDLFKYLAYKAKSTLPPKSENNKKTLFIPLDDIMLYAHLPDINFSMNSSPKYKDHDFTVNLDEFDTVAYIYLRDYIDEFFDYISNNYEAIIYSTAEKYYVDSILV